MSSGTRATPEPAAGDAPRDAPPRLTWRVATVLEVHAETPHARTLVDAFGPQRLTLIGIPGTPSLARMEELGVARCSWGPMSQNVALTALQELVEEVHRGGGVPSTMRMLN